MPTTRTKPRKTVADLERLPDGTRAELLDGEIYMSPSPSLRHQRLSKRLQLALISFVEARKLGEVLDAPLDVVLPSGDVTQPDLIVVLARNARICQDRIRGVPDLLVEIVSPENAERDRIVKRAVYARNGVLEYWIVDGESGAIEVLQLRDGAYADAGYFAAAETLVSPLLPGLSIALTPIFA